MFTAEQLLQKAYDELTNDHGNYTAAGVYAQMAQVAADLEIAQLDYKREVEVGWEDDDNGQLDVDLSAAMAQSEFAGTGIAVNIYGVTINNPQELAETIGCVLKTQGAN